MSGDVTIVFTATDTEHDSVSVYVEYSIDGGSAWYEMEIIGETSDIPADGSMRAVVWRSGNDLPGRDVENVGIRITVADYDTGATASIDGIHVDNNAPPAVTISVANPDSIYEDFIDIGYSLTDDENNMLGIEIVFSVDGGVNYSPASVTGTVYPIFSSGYLGSARWNISKDLSYYGDAVIRILPLDNDAGMPDSLTIAVNTFGVCAVTLAAPAGEHKSDIPVTFSLSDTRSNTITLSADYSLDDGGSWHAASIEGATTDIPPAEYNGTFTWLSTTDLDGRDGNFLLRVTPDNGAPGTSDMVSVSVDYNDPPWISQVLSDTTAIYSGSMRLAFIAADQEGDTVTLALEYSVDDGVTYVPATLTGSATASPGRYAELFWSTYADLGFIYEAGIYLRMSPSDTDPGEQYVAGPFTVSNIVGDFSFDGAINAADLVQFISIWNKQDTTRETGPATGSPPVLTVEPDGAIGFEDLTAFVWMWNWYSGQVAEKGFALARPAAPEAGETMDNSVVFTPDGAGGVAISCEKAPDFLSVVVIPEEGEGIDVSAHDNGYWSGDGIVLTRSYGGSAFEMAAADFGEAPARFESFGAVGALNLPRSTGDLRILFSVRFHGEEEIIEGETTVAGNELYRRPDAFTLSQNVPNPFNPSTVISFALPEDCDVTLIVRNITGQIVAELRNGRMYAGEYSVRWDAAAMANGVYFYTLRAGDFVKTRKMAVVK